ASPAAAARAAAACGAPARAVPGGRGHADLARRPEPPHVRVAGRPVARAVPAAAAGPEVPRDRRRSARSRSLTALPRLVPGGERLLVELPPFVTASPPPVGDDLVELRQRGAPASQVLQLVVELQVGLLQ